MKAGASFSSMPHTGKLKALICTADAEPGNPEVLADEARPCPAPPRRRRSVGVVRELPFRLAGVGEQDADPAVDVELRVPESRAGAVGELVVRLAPLVQVLRDAFRAAARSWKLSDASAGPPARRP